MDTLPAPLAEMAGTPAGLEDFRVAAPREIAALLRQLCDGNVPLNLNACDGGSYTTTLWSIDGDRGALGFCADVSDTRLQALLECEEVVVVGYLDSVKVQFDVGNLVLVRGNRASVLSGALPREIFRFQRRSAFRVRPPMLNAPTARMVHPEQPEVDLAMRIIDVSIVGCALFLPDGIAAPRPGVTIERVSMDLDPQTRLVVDIRLQHVTALNPDARGVRLGCEFLRADGASLRALQRFIDNTQKRGRGLALD